MITSYYRTQFNRNYASHSKSSSRPSSHLTTLSTEWKGWCDLWRM